MIFLLQFEFWFGHEKTRWLSCRRAGAILFWSLWPFSSGHGSPPTWLSHDDDGDRDGDGLASVPTL